MRSGFNKGDQKKHPVWLIDKFKVAPNKKISGISYKLALIIEFQVFYKMEHVTRAKGQTILSLVEIINHNDVLKLPLSPIMFCWTSITKYYRTTTRCCIVSKFMDSFCSDLAFSEQAHNQQTPLWSTQKFNLATFNKWLYSVFCENLNEKLILLVSLSCWFNVNKR